MRCKIGEIIFVDGGSVDGTLEIGSRMGHMTLNDQGEGLSAARNLGVKHASKDLILNFGPDNELAPEELEALLDAYASTDCSGLGMLTVVEGTGYWSKLLNHWRESRFRPGRVNVIGTPSLFEANLLKINGFNEERRFSDDGELGERLLAQGFCLRTVDAKVLEIGKATFRETWVRWRMYGVSDAEYVLNHLSRKSSTRVVFQSLTHAFRKDLLLPFKRLRCRNFNLSWGILVICAARYTGLMLELTRRFWAPDNMHGKVNPFIKD